MFKNIKEKIIELSFQAVRTAEESLDSATGKEKKDAAVEYIISMLPVSAIFKNILSIILSKFIDESIEKAVEYMNKIQYK